MPRGGIRGGGLGGRGAGGGGGDDDDPAGEDVNVALNNILINHDRVRRTTDIPLYFGVKEKDTITPQQLVERLERAARVAKWDTDELKCDQFFLSLRDEALKWSNTLDNVIGFNKNNWEDVKAKFLEAYAPKFSAKALCISFQDLKQKSQEDVQTFYNRVSETFRNAYSTKPAHVTTFVGALGPLPQADANMIMAQGLKRMELLVMNTVFQGGLREDIRTKVLEEGPTQIEESVKLAREIETILDKKKDRSVFVASMSNEEDSEVLEVDENEVEHLTAVNVIRKRRGLPALRFRVRRAQRGRSGSGEQRFPGTCYACGKFGHRIANCRSKKGQGKLSEIKEQDSSSGQEHLNF
jgi:hypothetical protein